jgi:hypothetical protein
MKELMRFWNLRASRMVCDKSGVGHRLKDAFREARYVPAIPTPFQNVI